MRPTLMPVVAAPSASIEAAIIGEADGGAVEEQSLQAAGDCERDRDQPQHVLADHGIEHDEDVIAAERRQEIAVAADEEQHGGRQS